MSKLAIAIGHNEGTGARAVDGTDEWRWNHEIAEHLQSFLKKHGVDSQLFFRDRNLGYTSAMRKHARDIKRAGCSHGMELHFNFHYKDSPANGFEFLYWWASRTSRKMSHNFANQLKRDFPFLTARKGKWYSGWVAGTKMLWLRSWNKSKADQRRGAEITFFTHCPFIIAEPCFASNPKEWERIKNRTKDIAESYGKAYLKTINA